MNKFDAQMEIIIESIDSTLRLCGATLAGLLIASGCLIYIQAAQTII